MNQRHQDPINIETIHDLPQLIKMTRETHSHLQDVKQGIAKLLDSQIDVVALLEELKPLRSLPDISNNLSTIVQQLIGPATKDPRRIDWLSVLIICTLGIQCTILTLKDADFKGALDWFGNTATLESHPEKKTN